MLRKVFNTLLVSSALVILPIIPAQANVTQLCGEGRLVDLFSGGWGGGEIFFKIDESVLTPPNYFAAGQKVLRVDPSIDDQHKNRIYSMLLLAAAKNQLIELRSQTQNTSGVADCKFISQVTLRADS